MNAPFPAAVQPCSLLASAETGLCCVGSVVFPLGSGLHLWNSLLSRVSGSVNASPPVKPRSCLEKTEDPVLSVRLVFHGHVVASVTPHPQTPPHQSGKYQPNCPDSVNHFLPTGAASPPMCSYYNCTFFSFNYRIRTTITNRAELMQLCLLCLCRIWANMLEH